MAALRELFARFQIGVNTAPLATANAAVDATKAHVAGLGEAFGKVAAVFASVSLVKELISTGKEIGTVALKLGMSTRELQQAAFVTGLGLDEFQIAARTFESHLSGAAEAGKGAGKAFGALGVPVKDAQGKTRAFSDILPDIADRFAAIQDPSKQTALALQLFGRQGLQMVPMLKRGRTGVDELKKKFDALGGGFTESGIKAARDVSKELRFLKFAVTSLKGRIAEALLPTLAQGATVFSRIGSVLIEVTRGTQVFAIAAAVAGAALVKSFLPVITTWAKPALIVGALILVIDDLVTMCRGGKSVIGEFLDSFFGAGTAQAAVESLGAAVRAVGRFAIEAAQDAIDAFEVISAAMPGSGRTIAGVRAAHAEREATADNAERAAEQFAAQVTAGEAQGPSQYASPYEARRAARAEWRSTRGAQPDVYEIREEGLGKTGPRTLNGQGVRTVGDALELSRAPRRDTLREQGADTSMAQPLVPPTLPPPMQNVTTVNNSPTVNLTVTTQGTDARSIAQQIRREVRDGLDEQNRAAMAQVLR